MEKVNRAEKRGNAYTPRTVEKPIMLTCLSLRVCLSSVCCSFEDVEGVSDGARENRLSVSPCRQVPLTEGGIDMFRSMGAKAQYRRKTPSGPRLDENTYGFFWGE